MCVASCSRSDRLKNHLEQSHDVVVDKQVNCFSCPFSCHSSQQLFRTTLLLAHCEQMDNQYASLPMESLILIIQTEFQMQLYRKYAHKMVY